MKHCLSRDRARRGPPWEEEGPLLSARLSVVGEYRQESGGEHDVAILSTFPLLDPYHHALGVDVGDAKVCRLRHSQPSGVDRHQDRTVFEGEVDMVVGTRMNRAETPLRVFLSTGLRILERIMFRAKQRDVTSAFRLMRVGPAQSIARRVKYSKYNFWLEFTAIATLRGYRMLEVPVAYRFRVGTSRVYAGSKILKAAIQELTSLLRIWRDSRLRGNRRETDWQTTGALPSP